MTLSLGPQCHRGEKWGCGSALAVVTWVTRSLWRFPRGRGLMLVELPGASGQLPPPFLPSLHPAPAPALLAGPGQGLPVSRPQAGGVRPLGSALPRASPRFGGLRTETRARHRHPSPGTPKLPLPGGHGSSPSRSSHPAPAGGSGVDPTPPSSHPSPHPGAPSELPWAVLGLGAQQTPPHSAPLMPGTVPLLTSFSFSCRTSSSWSGHSRGTRPLSPPPAR